MERNEIIDDAVLCSEQTDRQQNSRTTVTVLIPNEVKAETNGVACVVATPVYGLRAALVLPRWLQRVCAPVCVQCVCWWRAAVRRMDLSARSPV